MEWIRGIALFALAASLLLLLVPEGAGKRAAALACGAAMAVVLLSPLQGLTGESAAAWIRRYAEKGLPEGRVDAVEKEILCERVSAYIEARAAELGADLRAEAELVREGDSFRVSAVRLYGPAGVPDNFDETVRQELGVAKEAVEWVN